MFSPASPGATVSVTVYVNASPAIIIGGYRIWAIEMVFTKTETSKRQRFFIVAWFSHKEKKSRGE